MQRLTLCLTTGDWLFGCCFHTSRLHRFFFFVQKKKDSMSRWWIVKPYIYISHLHTHTRTHSCWTFFIPICFKCTFSKEATLFDQFNTQKVLWVTTHHRGKTPNTDFQESWLCTSIILTYCVGPIPKIETASLTLNNKPVCCSSKPLLDL